MFRLYKRPPSPQERGVVTAELLDDWLEGAQSTVNAKQLEFLELVVDRVKAEYNLPRRPPPSREGVGREPMRYLLHGPPGTGKSHVLHYVKELFDVIGLRQGVDWEILAYQNSNASDLGGRTIHAAFGLSQYGPSRDQGVSAETVKGMAHWRWLFVDEISLVPANILAKMDQRLREVKADADEWKLDSQGKGRPFGGVNILASGDFEQLPPVGGGYLADIPEHKLREPGEQASEQVRDPHAEQGRLLMWEDFQGVVELTERERCKDDWWNEVSDQIRSGKLSEDNWRYLHGKPVEGCSLLAEERASRRRVIAGPDDPRLQEIKFQEAPAVVASNDSKYQINKDRAKKYARDTGAALRWSIAKDVASCEALKAERCDKARKIRRLGANQLRSIKSVPVSPAFRLEVAPVPRQGHGQPLRDPPFGYRHARRPHGPHRQQVAPGGPSGHGALLALGQQGAAALGGLREIR